ncbi:PREDICTED: axin-1 isoform X1 [Trachymyrmex septentrionalis]|uniref:axin-1 isoform X1 n=1 Tax=Trachymyrmex septentrionalis TaxID=34720 RepID=UPI00084F7105|nr:PREDICTED: axin-1 isoform X1 [Trachymyrmex septentrionalis]XP_018343010.1 PREDICTED: axin-1 isoform X1 [Trachymyrmex septentrionalis]XP_018343011.1 PREDICTED: axin-1 isoform X1 [Trachymyrmex septentrionalis]XP_018343012.1 PREDICTED: axin-1 isoform X1 [Trachymyrmex septentrionalis]
MKAVIDRMNAFRQNEARCFSENSPRPPVPGEETGNYVTRIRPQSPALTPRRSSFATSQASGGCDVSAPLGFEPEGCCGTTTMESNSPPAYARWARSLHSLLEDPMGLELFKRYLSQEGHLDPLNFWFACEGLKEQKDMEKISQLVKLIYRRFFLKSQLSIPEDVMKEADRRVKEGRADHKVFDIVQLEVERLINETTYPNFLQSDVYLQYIQSYQILDSGGCPSSSSGSREMSLSCGPSLLPTVHEDSEYIGTGCVHMHNSHSTGETPGELRLTKDMLMVTQQSRAMDVRPRPEAYAGLYLQHGASPYHMHVPSRMHALYSSYNPVSRQDSELQSLSSDARTEVDNVSLNDGSIDSTGSRQRSKKQYSKQSSRAIKESANINRESMAHHVVPRTQRITSPKQMSPAQFAEELRQKLEIVQREQKAHEKLEKYLYQENDSSIGNDALVEPCGPSKSLGDALKEKLSMEEDSDQAILDEHVSRVWSDQTPSRSPRLSPERRRPTHNYPRPYKQRKEKDMDSTFSVDSGNIHDFQEGSDLVGAGSMSSLGSHLPKSKSVPSDYGDFLHKQDLHGQGHDQRFRRSDMTRRSATKKSMTELTDSGVSVVSDVQPSINKEVRLMPRFKEMDKKIDLKHSSRHGKRYGSRSGSLERPNREPWSMGVPAQPFVADPGMPPPPLPHTVNRSCSFPSLGYQEPNVLRITMSQEIQLEETRRRLQVEENRMRANCKRHPTVSKQPYEFASQYQPYVQSNQSTLRKPKQDDFTTVVFSFCDEQFPYRTRIPGHYVTLKQFKEYLPKKGSYRYFFKTECEDLDTKVIQEEITDDAEVLPLWEGKVMAQVKALE